MTGRRPAPWLAVAIALVALAASIGLLALIVSSDSDRSSGDGNGGGGGGGQDPSAELLEEAEGEVVRLGEKLGSRHVAESERLGVRAIDVSEEAGLWEYTRTHGAIPLDFDDDGWDDLLVNRHYFAYPRLYRNNGDRTFADVTGNLIPQPERELRDPHGCAAADVDRDGRIDVFCSTGGIKGGQGPNPKKLWIQQPDGTFRDRTRAYGVTDPWVRGRAVTFVDANGDGYPDLFHGATYPRSDGRPSPNHLFVNEDGERFRPAPELGVDGERDAAMIEAGDYDRDGREDLLLCGGDGLFLFRNAGADGYEDVTADAGFEPGRGCPGAALARFDRDGDPDIVSLSRKGVHVALQRDGRFEERFFLEVENARELAVGDVDGDGLDDVYVLRRGEDDDADYDDLMLVDRGDGERFVNMAIPQTRRGAGEDAIAIDYDRNGLTDFVVLNGKEGAEGPVRLIAFRPLRLGDRSGSGSGNR